MKKIIIKNNLYYDSVELMFISKELSNITNINEASVYMGNDHNKELLIANGFEKDIISKAKPNSLIIAINAQNEDVIDRALEKLTELLKAKSVDENDEELNPASLRMAMKYLPHSNIALISVPGEYAKIEAEKALDNNLNVMLFSDNVPLKDEILLKDKAVQKGLFMMGPDCGTAIINGTPLAFANKVEKGEIGIVAASGTGAQEVSVLISNMGGGISHVIGTGGRDLKEEVGGKMMKLGIEALAHDKNTKVIVLVSKPPAESVQEEILLNAKKTGKPVVVHFIKGNPEKCKKFELIWGENLWDTAIKALKAANYSVSDEAMLGFNMEQLEKQALNELDKGRKYLRGLYTGGTLCDETMELFEKANINIYSNTPFSPDFKLKNPYESEKNTIIDLGDDIFTQGKPHPMIEPSGRLERLEKELNDNETAVILMDVMLGYGSHKNPGGIMTEIIKKAKSNNKNICIIASVCGTNEDFQKRKEQIKYLKNAGVIIAPSNFHAAKLACNIIKKL